jgi:hypothetical protein
VTSPLTLFDIYVLEVLYYVLKLLRLETITFSDATLSDINVVLCYVLSQYRIDHMGEGAPYVARSTINPRQDDEH